jgi:hypothetical protein
VADPPKVVYLQGMAGKDQHALTTQPIRMTRRNGGLVGLAREGARAARTWATFVADEVGLRYSDWATGTPGGALARGAAPRDDSPAARVERRVQALEQALDDLGGELRRPVEDARAVEAAMAPLMGRIQGAVERAGRDLQALTSLELSARSTDDTAPIVSPPLIPAPVEGFEPSTNGAHEDVVEPARPGVTLEDPYNLLPGQPEQEKPASSRSWFKRHRSEG